MKTLADTVRKAVYRNGKIIVTMGNSHELRFPVAQNPRLARGTVAQLNNIEISPFGLHWPDLDEDLSFRGFADGDFGQRQPALVAESTARYVPKKRLPTRMKIIAIANFLLTRQH
jgi:hypothetical protein